MGVQRAVDGEEGIQGFGILEFDDCHDDSSFVWVQMIALIPVHVVEAEGGGEEPESEEEEFGGEFEMFHHFSLAKTW